MRDLAAAEMVRKMIADAEPAGNAVLYVVAVGTVGEDAAAEGTVAVDVAVVNIEDGVEFVDLFVIVSEIAGAVMVDSEVEHVAEYIAAFADVESHAKLRAFGAVAVAAGAEAEERVAVGRVD